MTPLTVPAASTANISSVTNFGDSITCGYYAKPNDGSGNVYSTAGYAGVLDTAIGKPSQNLCRAGDQAADMARFWVYPNARPALGASQLYTVMIGTNDASVCGAADGCLANFKQTLAASLAWLAMPGADKTLGSDITKRTGQWTSDLSFGLAATGPGATLTVPVQQTNAGRSLYLAYRVADLPPSAAGTALVALDGQQVAALNGNPDSGHVLLTVNGTLDSVFLATIPLGGAGAHELTITTRSQSAASFSFLWAGVPSTKYSSVSGAPRVILGGIPTTSSSALNTTVATYNSAVADLVNSLAANGLNVTIASTATALNISTDLSDELHPNAAGHAKLAQAFAKTL